jgi:osmoprotectant transport system ATP-binding protein
MTKMITLDDVTKRFGDSAEEAVRGLSMEIDEGEIVVLVGPSGCGKTTTMKMINRLIEPTSGSITVAGSDVMKHDPVQLRRTIGYVIQSVGLMPHRTIEQNIATVPRLLNWKPERIRGRVRELLDIFDLSDGLLGRYPSELSGGQRQRVGVARALAVDPPVMLMDEPFGAVDPIIRARLQDQFLDIQQQLQKTIVFVTHDIDEAIKMSDRIAILDQGAKIEQFAPPKEILQFPANDFVKGFVGAERGLKRLALIKISDVEIEEGPVVSAGASAEEARVAMRNFDVDWVSIVDEGRLLGWISASSLDDHTSVSGIEPRPFSAHVTSEDSLRQALDSIVTSRTHIAAVVSDDNRYEGVLSLEWISREVVS